MEPIRDSDIHARIERDNPWWKSRDVKIPEADSTRRVYFSPFKNLALNISVRRAAILLGPRRVGKTFMIKQLVHEAIRDGFDPKGILYASIDAPIYSGLSLEKFLGFMPKAVNGTKRIVIFDEIQYFPRWEIHLKDLVDNHPDTKFIATGSAAAALKLKSQESGAGRFSEFMLPPLTFYEFLCFIGKDEELVQKEKDLYHFLNIDDLNHHFLDYLNFGGYPEGVLNPEIRNNPEQFIRSDIIDKVLLKDLPNLYGIDNIQEMNRLFSFLAYNAGNEASFENLSKGSGVSKQTLKKYIEYLESAFLIIKIPTVDDNCRTFLRERNFKIYLNNPSMRAALFSPLEPHESDKIGHLAESAVFSQWQHSSNFRHLRYARWRQGRQEGEVDIVYLSPTNVRPVWIGEVKWSDAVMKNHQSEMKSIVHFLRKHPTLRDVVFTTKSAFHEMEIENRKIFFFPTAVYCYTVGRNITADLERPTRIEAIDSGLEQSPFDLNNKPL